MTTRQISIDEDDFQAFVDGQLPPDRRRAVMAYLAATPEEAARMSDYRTLTEEMHLRYDEVLYEPLPARLRVERYHGHTAWWAKPLRWVGLAELSLAPRAVGVALLLLAGASGGWMLGLHYIEPAAEPPVVSFTRFAVNAHELYASDMRHPVEFGADQQEPLLLWLSERLGQAVQAPHLQDLGFRLVGGRLLPSAGQPAAQLMYENPDTHRITLYIRGNWPSAAGAAHDGTVTFASDNGISLVYWLDGPFAYALLGALDREQLFATAKIIQQQRTATVITPEQAVPVVAPEQTATAEKGST
jgi:anti-sigma factor RsiW